MNKKKVKNKEEILVDKEYIRNCLALTYEERLKAIENLNKFIFEAMPEESKQSWEKLKKFGL